MKWGPSARWFLSSFSSSSVSHFTDEEIEAEKGKHQGYCHLYKLELVLGGHRKPRLVALPVGYGIGIQVTLEKWPQGVPKATCTHHLLLALKNSHFSRLPTTRSQVSGWLSSPRLDMWVPDVHSFASSCAFASCRRYHMPISTHQTSEEQSLQEKKHLTWY